MCKGEMDSVGSKCGSVAGFREQGNVLRLLESNYCFEEEPALLRLLDTVFRVNVFRHLSSSTCSPRCIFHDSIMAGDEHKFPSSP